MKALSCLLAGLVVWGIPGPGEVVEADGSAARTPGMLEAFGPDGTSAGPCPLKHTDVQAEISGLTARVTVTQVFHNALDTRIEAVYTFPLSERAAVDDMTMTVGDRVIRGQIKPREQARQIYEAARQAGRVAGLLDQERPNIFTQSIANIEPGERVEIQIRYVETLPWREGVCSFSFPMVVGPRYIPGTYSRGRSGTGFAADTDRVPDAGRVTPPVTPEGTRAGHDLSLAVRVNAGRPIGAIASRQHRVNIEYLDAERTGAAVTLKDLATIPNKDFVLEITTADDTITDALVTHTDERGQFFTLILQPPQRVDPEWVMPREVIFVIDRSGSMRGFPIDTAKEVMRRCIRNLNPADTFNLMTFAGGVGFCFDEPVASTRAHREQALAYLQTLQGGGGTEMMKAINACLARQKDPERVRIVCFMTDGFVGNDMAIIEAVERNAGVARVFAFGIGTSVNRFLLEGMARAGRGDVEFVLGPEQCEASAERFYERINRPVLTDIEIDWGDLMVEETFPRRIPDLFDAGPVVVKGRYASPGAGTITLRGERGDGPFERAIEVVFPETRPADESVATLWARAKVEELMNGDLAAVQGGMPDPAVREQIVGLGMNYRLLTQFTSFVAVEELTITRGGELRTITVPVEMPEGVSYEGVFGEQRARGVRRGSIARVTRRVTAAAPPPAAKMPAGYDGGGVHSAEVDRAAAPLDRKGGRPRSVEAIERDRTLSPEDRRALLLVAKLDASLRMAGGQVEVAVFVKELSAKTIERLEAAGLTVLARTTTINLVIGVIDAARLEELALLDEVRRVEPPKYDRR